MKTPQIGLKIAPSYNREDSLPEACRSVGKSTHYFRPKKITFTTFPYQNESNVIKLQGDFVAVVV